MTFLYMYALFCLTSAIYGIFELLIPVLGKVPDANNKVLIILTFFVFALLTAPMIFLASIIPSTGIIFRESLETGLFPQD